MSTNNSAGFCGGLVLGLVLGAAAALILPDLLDFLQYGYLR